MIKKMILLVVAILLMGASMTGCSFWKRELMNIPKTKKNVC